MKRTILYVWTAVAGLSLIVAICVYSGVFSDKLKVNKYLKEKELLAKYKNNIYSADTIDSLLNRNSPVMLVVGAIGCSTCDMILLSDVPKKLNIQRYFIEKKSHPANDLLVQALYASGAPTSFVIDRDYNIIGAFYGVNELREKLEGIIARQAPVIHTVIPGVLERNMLQMLSCSLQSLNAWLSQDCERMYIKALESLDYGSYFFNNYLLYIYHTEFDSANHACYYKSQALHHIENVGDAIVYETSLKELDPDNEFLYWLELHNESISGVALTEQ